MYKTLVQPHIDYGLTVWGYSPNCQVDRVQKLQNKIIRIISGNFSWDISPRDILQEYNIPNVRQRRDYFNSVQVYRCNNDSYPNYMSDLLNPVNVINTRATRNSEDDHTLYIPKPRVNLFRQSFQYTGPSLYNSLPNNIKHTDSLPMFKSNVKRHIMSHN